MKIAIFGASGLVGSYAVKTFANAGYNVVQITNKSKGDYSIDAVDSKALSSIIEKEKPNVVLNAIKNNLSTDASEVQKQETWSSNVQIPENLARLQYKHGFNLIHISTEWIYEGLENETYSENSIPYPQNFYSLSKLIGEERVRNIATKYVILRTGGIYGIDTRGANFFMRVKNGITAKTTISCPIDQFSQPIFAGELAKIIKNAVEKNAKGIYNAVSPDYVSRYELAQSFCEVFGWDKALLAPVNSSQRAIKIPKFLKLNISKIENEVTKISNLRKQVEQLKGELKC